MPLLEEAIAFIAMLVNDSAGFKQGPDDEADDWKYIRGKIVAPDGSLNYEGIELLSGRHFQHVASDALQQDMYSAIVDDPSVHPATRAHFRAAKQLGAGAVLGIDAIEDAVELPDEAFLHEVQGYTSTTPEAPSPSRRGAPARARGRSASTTRRSCASARRAPSAPPRSRTYSRATNTSTARTGMGADTAATSALDTPRSTPTSSPSPAPSARRGASRR